MPTFSDAELTAFINESLAADRSSELEAMLRNDESLRQRLAETSGREFAGLHTIAAIWQRRRLSCPTRDELGMYIMGALETDHQAFIRFHLDDLGCRYCTANHDDLKSGSADDPAPRRRKFFQTSAGHLRSKD